MSQFKGFYKKKLDERLEIIQQLPNLPKHIRENLKHNTTLDAKTANSIIENYFHLYGVPMGIAPNFLINGKLYHAPLATEEPSVIAAASFGAQLIQRAGGFTVVQNNRQMIGEIALYNVKNISETIQVILAHEKKLLNIANHAYPSIVNRGGGATHLKAEHHLSKDNISFVIVYLFVDTKEAMGANMLNTMLEALVPTLEQLTDAPALMAILSNYATASLTQVTCQIPCHMLSKTSELSGEKVRDQIILAYQLATADIYRATTHNKGIMNGVSAIVLATGNDTRAIEAGAHAYASHTGKYFPLTTWEKADNGDLKGNITLPLPIGFVGGSINIHPSAQIAQHISQTTSAKELACLIASVGLAQNFSALRALVTEGIQKGHMALQLKSLALSVGAAVDEIPLLLEQLKQQKIINQETALNLLNTLRNKKE